MTRGYCHIPDGEGPGRVELTYENRMIPLCGPDAAKARKQHEHFVACFGHDSPEEITWIATRVMETMAAD